jgi:uncharacterized protein
MTVPLKTMISRLPVAEQKKVKARAAELIAAERVRLARGKATPAYHLYLDIAGDWQWQLIAPTGKVLATSAEGYKSKKACLIGIQRVRSAASAEALVMETV